MQKLIKQILSVTLISVSLVIATQQKTLAQDADVSYQTFYDDLSPYGQWVSDPQYGDVWVPNEDGDFRPYGSRGHWVMTDYGNTWVSDDPWGWACYHYGRWTYDPYYGWVWIPGYEWAPAWVSWRYGGGYSGWAPLGPGATIGVTYNCPESWWIFVAPQYMYQPDCIHYWRGPSYNATYIHQTTFVNNYYVDNHTRVRYNFGPRADVITRDTHQPVQVYHVSQMNRPGAPGVKGNTVSMYRPAINRATATTARPSNVVQAPRAISHSPRPATNIEPGQQPAFRQHIQQQGAPNNAQPGGRSQPANNQPRQQPAQQPHQQPIQQPRQQPAQQPHQQPMQQPRQQPAQQPHQQPMQQPRQQPMQQPRQQPMQQPRQQPMQQPRQQPMQQPRQQPMQQPRQQPMQQPRQQPMQQPRPQPMQQPRMQQAAPRPAPPPRVEPALEGGGRR